MIIKSILDNDLYKFTVSFAYMQKFPNALGTFTFVDRNNTVYTKEQYERIKCELMNMDVLHLSASEKEFMQNKCYFIPPHYFEWLESYRYNPKQELSIGLDSEGHLSIHVTGLLYRITLWEVPILAIVSQILSEFQGNINMKLVLSKTMYKAKIAEQENLKFSEFGTRRRASYYTQDLVVETLSKYAYNSLVGTSNCHFAHKYNLTPIGTHPHEWFMFHGAMYGYSNANYLALTNWADVYDGDLGIALSDTYTSDVFFKNFSKRLAKLYDGVRQDSGDPFKFISKATKRYRELGVDPSTKTIVFSDALTMDKAVEIKNNCQGRIKCSFGIGTHLTNDIELKPANIVMKLTSCQINKNNPIKDCIKLSDSEGKHLGPEKDIEICKYECGI